MEITFHCIGKMRRGPEAALVNEYLKRASGLGRGLGFSGPDLHEFEAPRSLAPAKRIEKEGDWLAAAAQDGAAMVLDEKGENLTSKALAGFLAQLRDDGVKRAAFLIGGADGHAPRITAKARRLIAFGKATWPHMLVRAMLSEQIYRSMTILAAHPYHRA